MDVCICYFVHDISLQPQIKHESLRLSLTRHKIVAHAVGHCCRLFSDAAKNSQTPSLGATGLRTQKMEIH